MLDDLQVKTAQAIVNIFETGRALGDYGRVTLIKGDTGHLTYGRSQTTLASGNLYLLIRAYCEEPESMYGTALTQYLDRLAGKDFSLDADMPFRALLRDAGDDPCMHGVQNRFFDRIYWTPAINDASHTGIFSALGTAVVYDSRIHGSWKLVRDMTTRSQGTLSALGEQKWINCYVSERRNWLTRHPNPALHPTAYRMDAFLQLIQGRKWELALPITVRGIRIDEDVLTAGAPVRVSAQDPNERNLQLQVPFMVGDDVEEVQQALLRAGITVEVDGIYAHLTEAAVRRFQQQKGLVADGVAGPATRSVLGL